MINLTPHIINCLLFPPTNIKGKSYDRSVFGVDECTKNLKGDGSDSCCCYMCSHAPLVIVSSGEAICDQYSIRLRNVREFIDGGLLAVRNVVIQMLYLYLEFN